MGLTVLAHQGGWDEALLVAAPLLVFAGLVWNAKRRAGRLRTDDANGADLPSGKDPNGADLPSGDDSSGGEG